MPTWPASIRFCPVDGTYSEEPVDSVVRTEFDSGPVKTRNRFTAVPTNIQFALPWLTGAEFAVFRTWFETDLSRGALSFDATHPITGDLKTFRFRKPYRASKAGKHIVIQIDLEMLP